MKHRHRVGGACAGLSWKGWHVQDKKILNTWITEARWGGWSVEGSGLILLCIRGLLQVSCLLSLGTGRKWPLSLTKHRKQNAHYMYDYSELTVSGRFDSIVESMRNRGSEGFGLQMWVQRLSSRELQWMGHLSFSAVPSLLQFYFSIYVSNGVVHMMHFAVFTYLTSSSM